MYGRRRACALTGGLALAILATIPRPARGETAPSEATDRDWGFLQGGLGLLEVAHVEAGIFATPKLDLELWLTWAGVFGSRAGIGATYIFGASDGLHTPSGGFTVGARVMLNRQLEFDNHGDDLSSYVAVPVGYAWRRNSGLYWRVAVAAVVVRGRKSQNTPPPPGQVPPIEHTLQLGGPFVTASMGLVF